MLFTDRTGFIRPYSIAGIVSYDINSQIPKQMKYVLFLAAVVCHFHVSSQTSDTTGNKPQLVTLRGRLNLNYYGKGSLWMKGYIVDVDRKVIEKFSGKRVKITGRLVIVPDLAKRPKEYDQNGNEIIYQGIYGSDAKYVMEPSIKWVWFW
jgi:hypothetical protein